MNDLHAFDLPTVRRADFPPDFRWGCATAAFQIEGAANEDGKGESIWDRFCSRPGNVRNGDTGLVACDHYHRWPQDLDLAVKLGVNAYRFSIAWPRIFPGGRGTPNERGLAFYDRLVDGMLERGLEPWATLYHWDLPQPLQEEGGWASRRTVDAFVDYSAAVTRRLGDRVKRWITHNEPWCTAFLGHHEGIHAPGLRDLSIAMQVCHHVLLSHGKAVPAIRAAVKDAQVGITLSMHPILPASGSAADAAAVRRHDSVRNAWFMDALSGRGYPAEALAALGAAAPRFSVAELADIATRTDFLGVNYYFPEIVADAPGEGMVGTRVAVPPGTELTAFGWPVMPEGLVLLLERVAREWGPRAIYITENGSTFDDAVRPDGRVHDPQRRRYLARHLAAARECLARGVPLAGYFAWSLLDNFEWAEGYERRFGLTYVDFQTQQRTLKASGQWYANFLGSR